MNNAYDAVIVGGGPAGLTAALYLARARYRVLVIEKDHFGGQITITDEIVNYPGVLKTSGVELTETMRQQAESFGAEFMLAEVTNLEVDGDLKHVETTKGTFDTLSILVATGASPRQIGFEGEERFKGHGVAYCATCDGEFFSGKEVFVVGGGFAAAEESVFLTKYAKHVTLLVREEDFTCAAATAEKAKNHPMIDVHYNAEMVKVDGEEALTKVVWKDIKTGEEHVVEAEPNDYFGVFVFVGYAPATDLARDVAELDEQNYVLTNEQNQTTAQGVFAAGDVTVKPLRQVATAVGQAATTATEMERYIKQVQERTGIVGKQPATRFAKPVETPEVKTAPAQSTLFDEDTLSQLGAVFERMAKPLTLRLYLDERPVSEELSGYVNELVSLSDKLALEQADAPEERTSELPFIEVCQEDGTPSGLEFHGVPGGHEFTSFILGLYNVSGPGQPIADADRAGIASIKEKVDIDILVSLSCTMCPETVLSAQRIAADNEGVTAHVYDISHFGDLKDKYNVMSVPCVVVKSHDAETVSFGKKNLSQMLELVQA